MVNCENCLHYNACKTYYSVGTLALIDGDCSSCGRDFSGTGIADYCYHCGQALDWGDAE